MKITASILTYNEGDRIAIAIKHAKLWADEVLVLDKSSTDNMDSCSVAWTATGDSPAS